MVQLIVEPIDVELAVHRVQSAAAGAVVMFLGTTREFTQGRQTTTLHYDAYAEMATHKLAELETQARQRWPIVECLLIHRLGEVKLGEASVLVAVSTPHRQDAFAAAHWLIDTLKLEVPIWKQEHWADGSSEWVHPGAPPGLNDSTS